MPETISTTASATAVVASAISEPIVSIISETELAISVVKSMFSVAEFNVSVMPDTVSVGMSVFSVNERSDMAEFSAVFCEKILHVVSIVSIPKSMGKQSVVACCLLVSF